MGAAVLLVGCQKSPLKGDLPRTPYTRYQTLRGQAPPLEETDSFGGSQKALRARLAPLDRP